MDDFDLAFGVSDTPSETTGQAAETPSGEPAAPAIEAKPAAGDGAKPPQAIPQGDGTAKPELQPGKEEPKGVFPKELEPFKDLFDSRKLDPTKPEGVAKLAQSYKEVESFAQQSQTRFKNANDAKARVEAAALGSVEDLNKLRTSRGLPAIAVDARTPEDREKEFDELFGAVDRALKGDAAAIDWLNTHFSKQRESVMLAKLEAKSAKPSKTADDAFKERNTAAKTVFADAFRANPQAKAYVDELTPYFDAGGAFDALGFDVLDAFATPERAAAFVELGQALSTHRNLDKIVADRVKGELDRQRSAVNAGGPGNGAAKGKSTPAESETEFNPVPFFTR
jgi:hypothetical protein